MVTQPEPKTPPYYDQELGMAIYPEPPPPPERPGWTELYAPFSWWPFKHKMKFKRKSKRFSIQDRLDDLLASHEEQRDALKRKQDRELEALWEEAMIVNRRDPICEEIWFSYHEADHPMPSIQFRRY